jgi:hypothetical protein
VFGFPDWVFWGIITPWVTCVVVGLWFSYAFMTDEEVGDVNGAGDESGENPSA